SVLKLVTRVKQLEGLLQQQKQRLVLSNSEGEDTTPTEQDIDLEALHTLAHMSLGGDSSDMPAGHDAAEVPTDTSMPFCSPSTTRRRLKKPFSSFAFAHAPENVPAGAGISAAATTIPAGSPMDVAVHNLHDSQLGEEIAKKIHAKQEAEFARQQEQLAQKAQAKRVTSPTVHGLRLSD
nr:hypothetical protein [Tanacetum cinerariifolium]